jgi:hypothetical protein
MTYQITPPETIASLSDWNPIATTQSAIDIPPNDNMKIYTYTDYGPKPVTRKYSLKGKEKC